MLMGYKTCPQCGKQFWDCLQNKRKFCSRRCKFIYFSKQYYHNKKKHNKEYMQRSLQRLRDWMEKKKQEKVAAGVENANPPACAGGLLNGGETKC